MAIDIDRSAGNDNGHVRQSATVGRWQRDDAHPVSYTHLDVYKRQNVSCEWP